MMPPPEEDHDHGWVEVQALTLLRDFGLSVHSPGHEPELGGSSLLRLSGCI